jgi:hypothetical protein
VCQREREREREREKNYNEGVGSQTHEEKIHGNNSEVENNN